MKVHYINILLFAFPLNIQVSSRKNRYSTHNTPNQKPIREHRRLCECVLYTPTKYVNYPEMKFVMENYNRQASERFKEYDGRMIKNRQKCKEKCDKEIQKIILKDKIEKELTEKLSKLQTDVSTDNITPCICKKSLVDKMEKKCLKCTQNLVGIVAPSSGVLEGIAQLALSAWKTGALLAAEKAAKEAGIAAGIKAGEASGLAKFIDLIESTFFTDKLGGTSLKSFFNTTPYTEVSKIANVIFNKYETICTSTITSTSTDSMCQIGHTLNLFPQPGQLTFSKEEVIRTAVNEIFTKATAAAEAAKAKVTATKTLALEEAKKSAIETTCMGYQSTIIASIVAILIIILVMVIIYLILRYRRKKKMKKKLQYIKLLKE